MDRWIELGRLYRRMLCTASDLEGALEGLRLGGSPGFRRLLDNGTNWTAVMASDLEADKRQLLEWYDDIRVCDLGRGIDIIHVEVGLVPRSFEISAWRWADHIMLIDDGLIEPDSIRTVSVPGRFHRPDDLPSGLWTARPQSGPDDDFASLAVWLLFCSWIPLEKYATANLQALWGIDREFAVIFSSRDAAFHGGFVTPTGWKRPLKRVEAPAH